MYPWCETLGWPLFAPLIIRLLILKPTYKHVWYLPGMEKERET
jgi:hypothetical protein